MDLNTRLLVWYSRLENQTSKSDIQVKDHSTIVLLSTFRIPYESLIQIPIVYQFVYI